MYTPADMKKTSLHAACVGWMNKVQMWVPSDTIQTTFSNDEEGNKQNDDDCTYSSMDDVASSNWSKEASKISCTIGEAH